MANCVRHSVLARLNADAGLAFFFLVAHWIPEAPYLRAFCPGVRR
ncbi:pyrBI operon leader peptide [Klebsiella variicola subsp. variicola]|nr:pyrBI operon leader peptide [Klebsiella variicola subsp. variicola]